MKNYFEWEDGSLVVFDKVSKINIKEDIIEIYTNTDEYWILKLDNYIEQLPNYKAWLALKQQALEDSIKPIYAISPLQNKISLDEGITTVSSDYSKPEITDKMLFDRLKALDFDACSVCEFNNVNVREYPCCECSKKNVMFKLKGNSLEDVNKKL